MTSIFTSIKPLRFDLSARPEDTSPKGKVTRSARRRMAILAEAKAALEVIPDRGDTLHAIMTGVYDLAHLLVALIERLASPVEQMRIATLSLSPKNVQELAGLMDAGSVRGLDVLVSDFFHKHDKSIFEELQQEVCKRGGRVAVARSHCKIVTLALEDGRRFVMEGSANLRTNKNLEQFALSECPELHEWYSGWLEQMMVKHGTDERKPE